MQNTEKKHKCESAIEVLDFLKLHGLTDKAELVGRWVWLTFDAKPDEGIRQALKEAGFYWSPRWGSWVHNCGHPTKPGKGNPRHKYPVCAVSDLEPAIRKGEVI